MNIYLLSQPERDDWDTYDSCVVIAEDEEQAKLIHPNSFYKFREEFNKYIDNYDYNSYLDTGIKPTSYYNDSWCQSPETVTVQYIGEFKGNIENYPSRIVCSSFNAG